MSPRRARFTQIEIERSIRAARKTGAAGVEIRPSDGTITIRLVDEAAHKSERDVDRDLDLWKEVEL